MSVWSFIFSYDPVGFNRVSTIGYPTGIILILWTIKRTGFIHFPVIKNTKAFFSIVVHSRCNHENFRYPKCIFMHFFVFQTLRFPSDSEKDIPFYLDGDLTFITKSRKSSVNGEKVGIQTVAGIEVGAGTKLQTGAGTGARPRCQYGSLERYPQQQQRQISMRLTEPRTIGKKPCRC